MFLHTRSLSSNRVTYIFYVPTYEWKSLKICEKLFLEMPKKNVFLLFSIHLVWEKYSRFHSWIRKSKWKALIYLLIRQVLRTLRHCVVFLKTNKKRSFTRMTYPFMGRKQVYPKCNENEIMIFIKFYDGTWLYMLFLYWLVNESCVVEEFTWKYYLLM